MTQIETAIRISQTIEALPEFKALQAALSSLSEGVQVYATFSQTHVKMYLSGSWSEDQDPVIHLKAVETLPFAGLIQQYFAPPGNGPKSK